jgi:hypothetical protein
MRGNHALAHAEKRGNDDGVRLRASDEKMNFCVGLSAGFLDFFSCAYAIFIFAVSGKRLKIRFREALQYFGMRARSVIAFK